MSKLQQTDIEKFKEVSKEYGKSVDLLSNRMVEVLQAIAKGFGKETSSRPSYWFSDAGEGELGTMRISSYDKSETIDNIITCGYPCMDTGSWDYGDSIPVYFLYTEDEEITRIVKEEIEHNKEQEKIREEKAAKTKEDSDLRRLEKQKISIEKKIAKAKAKSQ
jgi:hypothetical protein